ncbi:hypothetical protein TVAG_295610 [Trichomonas vaginalis G3]|uniref:Uncharacterized protein n=1 Tax=Trichomonas vaginalis (strain ATCC PRA-98 / G3) TaxID=412133 RepID=A2F228_TRIV3|nr:hypothetical protein TVAGG3_0971530 [Trichomonas vaginalis G3]EAY01027.1 hypothetical protein TVAG_295610 [Trichomonas vaginalis G3]KAI5488622.1 hypothetical protein TVAGG3_0971530 [Trichomonas vaginalis G3]|eukprot:XP_001313913.1 hypothetical protein [Trichomonas vaginalis G3]
MEHKPNFIQRFDDRFIIDQEGVGPLIVFPVYRTLREFSKTKLQVRVNELILSQELIYRGEWLMDKVLYLPQKTVKQFTPVHRNNYRTESWIHLLPQDVLPPGPYSPF